MNFGPSIITSPTTLGQDSGNTQQNREGRDSKRESNNQQKVDTSRYDARDVRDLPGYKPMSNYRHYARLAPPYDRHTFHHRNRRRSPSSPPPPPPPPPPVVHCPPPTAAYAPFFGTTAPNIVNNTSHFVSNLNNHASSSNMSRNVDGGFLRTGWNTTAVTQSSVLPSLALQNALLLNSIYGTTSTFNHVLAPKSTNSFQSNSTSLQSNSTSLQSTSSTSLKASNQPLKASNQQPTAVQSPLTSSLLSDALTLLQQTLHAFEQKSDLERQHQQPLKQRAAGGCLRCKKELTEFYDVKIKGWRMNHQCPPEDHLYVASTLSFDTDTRDDSCHPNIVCANCALPSEKLQDISVISEDEYDPTEPQIQLAEIKTPEQETHPLSSTTPVDPIASVAG
jgi:hypothetical protein